LLAGDFNDTISLDRAMEALRYSGDVINSNIRWRIIGSLTQAYQDPNSQGCAGITWQYKNVHD